MPSARPKNVRFDRVGQGRGERVLMVLEFCVELVKSTFAQFGRGIRYSRCPRPVEGMRSDKDVRVSTRAPFQIQDNQQGFGATRRVCPSIPSAADRFLESR